MIYIGIDPGLTGAIGVLDSKGRFVDVYDIPTQERANHKNKVTKEIDVNETVKIFQALTDLGSYQSKAIIEAQTIFPGMHAATMGSLIETYAALKAVMTLEKIPFEIAWPISWKTKQGLKGKKKDYSLSLAISLWPSAPLHREKDHNRAEALLLAKHLFEMQRGAAA